MKPSGLFYLNTECMDFLEKDLEEIIYNADRELLRDKGLWIYGKMYKQLKIGNYGIADIVTAFRDGNCLIITVYELKKDKIGISAFLQAVTYARGIERYINHRKRHLRVELNIVLIGREIDKKSSFSYLADMLPCNSISPFLSCYTYNYNINGITFEEETGYKLIDEGFKLSRDEN